jgi:hypothetical protein
VSYRESQQEKVLIPLIVPQFFLYSSYRAKTVIARASSKYRSAARSSTVFTPNASSSILLCRGVNPCNACTGLFAISFRDLLSKALSRALRIVGPAFCVFFFAAMVILLKSIISCGWIEGWGELRRFFCGITGASPVIAFTISASGSDS